MVCITMHEFVNTTRYCKYSRAPDDGRKHRPKHIEPTWNNKLIYIVHLVGYFHGMYHDARIHERQGNPHGLW